MQAETHEVSNENGELQMQLEIIKLKSSILLMDLYKAPDGGFPYSSPD